MKKKQQILESGKWYADGPIYSPLTAVLKFDSYKEASSGETIACFSEVRYYHDLGRLSYRKGSLSEFTDFYDFLLLASEFEEISEKELEKFTCREYKLED